MSTPKKKKNNAPLIVVIILAILLAGGAVGCLIWQKNIRDYKAGLLETKVAEVQERNAEREAEYALAMAEFEAANASNGNEGWPAQSMTGWDVVDLSNYPLENEYTQVMTRGEVMNNGMLLVNAWHSRPEDFDESALVSVSNYTEHAIPVSSSSVKLFPVMVDALKECLDAAKAEGYENYVAYEAYRSWDTQNELFQKEMTKLSSKYSGETLIEKAKENVNYPGTSEYNTGLAARIVLYKKGDETVNKKIFFECDEGVWLYENSWKYGIVHRFALADYPVKGTADKSYKTGITGKHQIFRYVGRGNAAVMHTLDLCLEEYLEYLMEHPHLAVFEDGTLKYEIYRQYVGDDDSFVVRLNRSAKGYTVSLDNLGYVVTVFEY